MLNRCASSLTTFLKRSLQEAREMEEWYGWNEELEEAFTGEELGEMEYRLNQVFCDSESQDHHLEVIEEEVNSTEGMDKTQMTVTQPALSGNVAELYATKLLHFK